MQCHEYFNSELNLIQNQDIKNETIRFLDNYVYKGCFYLPASSTGKYHPVFANKKQGLVKHTRALVKMLLVFLESRPDISVQYRDHMICASILHDMAKYEYNNKDHTVTNHAEIMSNLFKEKSTLNTKDIDIIYNMIKYHQGYYDQEGSIESYVKQVYNFDNQLLSEAVLMIHYSDMIVSRKWYSTKDIFVE